MTKEKLTELISKLEQDIQDTDFSKLSIKDKIFLLNELEIRKRLKSKLDDIAFD